MKNKDHYQVPAALPKDCPYTQEQIAQINREYDQRHGYCGIDLKRELPSFKSRPVFKAGMSQKEKDAMVWAGEERP